MEANFYSISPSMILFLDFDGVLHPFPVKLGDKTFCAVDSLWKILEAQRSLSVVITSTWREQHSVQELVSLLSLNGGESFRDRFVGVTPSLENDAEYIPGVRQREIELWLSQNEHSDTPYFILDDIADYFDSDCKNLYLVDGTTGLTDHDVEKLSLWLRTMD